MKTIISFIWLIATIMIVLCVGFFLGFSLGFSLGQGLQDPPPAISPNTDYQGPFMVSIVVSLILIISNIILLSKQLNEFKKENLGEK